MRILLISTYELGRQPVHLASPTAALRAAGHEVVTVDLSVENLEPAVLEDVDGVAMSVPMHTAMRLALSLAEQARKTKPEIPIALYGLYAGVGSEHSTGHLGAAVIAGEYEDELVDWADGLSHGSNGGRKIVSTKASAFSTPDRSGLPPLTEYARLEWNGEARLVGAVEASHGCRHRCRHCPIPVLYDGRLRVVGADTVLADIEQLVGSGAEHITFGDPDFLNAPRYSLDILRSSHAAHPELTYDITVKVSHILQHRELWPEMARLGALFVVSAFESVDQFTLDVLDKNHTVADMEEAITILSDAGVFLRPTWLPFFPWTAKSDLADLVGFLDQHRLWEATDPVQLAIKLLVPEGSLLEDHPALAPHLAEYDPQALTWKWDFVDPEVGDLHRELDAVAADASDCGKEAMTTAAAMRRVIGRVNGFEPDVTPLSGRTVPRLTESWFCCAEPTAGQAVAAGLTVVRVTR